MSASTSAVDNRFAVGCELIVEARRKPGTLGVCFGCGGIVRTKAAVCPACLGYRFNADPEVVVDQVMLISARPGTSVLEGDLA